MKGGTRYVLWLADVGDSRKRQRERTLGSRTIKHLDLEERLVVSGLLLLLLLAHLAAEGVVGAETWVSADAQVMCRGGSKMCENVRGVRSWEVEATAVHRFDVETLPPIPIPIDVLPPTPDAPRALGHFTHEGCPRCRMCQCHPRGRGR